MKVGDKVRFVKSGEIGTVESISIGDWKPPIFHVKLDGKNLYAWAVDEANPNKDAIGQNFEICTLLKEKIIFS